MKARLNSISNYILPAIMLFAGLFYLFAPIASGWLEVFAPWIYRVSLLYADWIAFVLFMSGFPGEYVVLFLFIIYMMGYWRFAGGLSPRQRSFWKLPIFILPILLLLTISFGLTYSERRGAAIHLGGKSLVFFAGGPEKVREGASDLLKSTRAIEPLKATWPASIQKLRGYVLLDHDSGYVQVGHGRAHSFYASEFGLIITEGGDFPAEFEAGSYWDLYEGIFLYIR